ncbi:MAG: LLM class flavin-dependent oxidoreductase [Microcella sp.]|uniref:LLM class flavin-dependent oxidoreductase n=1 Tax=Microcella sp. TaxID=1913979 RepID=UPI00331620EC
MKFGFKLSIHGQHTDTRFSEFIDLARRAEGVGFDGVFVVDHLLLPGSRLVGYTNAPVEKPYFHDAWTALAAIAQATTSVKVGPQVTPIGLRHPVFIAKWGATVDQISEGRLLLQVGAGHQKIEYESYGFEYPNLARRVERLKEGIEVIRELWESEDVANYEGEHYVLRDVPFFPKPYQERPEIWLGGGSTAIKSLVAHHGDGWTPAAPQYGGITPEAFRESMAEIRDQVTDERVVTPAALFYAVVTEDPSEVERALDMLRRRTDWSTYSREEFRKKAIVLAGSPSEIIDYIEQYKAAGMEYISLAFLPTDDLAGTRRMIDAVGSHVIPHFA